MGHIFQHSESLSKMYFVLEKSYWARMDSLRHYDEQLISAS